MRSKGLTALSIIMLLSCSGCFLPAYGLGQDERSVDVIMDDTIIRSDIKSAIMRKDPTLGYEANIYSYKGHVYLVGAIPESFRAVVQEEAHKVKDVHAVTSIWFPESADSNTELVLNIRAALVSDGKVSSTQIDIEAYGSEVILLGVVHTRADVNRAVSVAGKVSGVSKVRSYLTTTK